MKPPDEARKPLVRQWLDKAEEDFLLAEHLVKEQYPSPAAIAFHSQQAAEKYLKAFLVWHQIEFPKTHDVEKLLDLVATRDSQLADVLEEAGYLSQYGVDVRYPGEMSDLTGEESTHAFETASKVRNEILSALKMKPSNNA
jgi:HEPN domain-containing protein